MEFAKNAPFHSGGIFRKSVTKPETCRMPDNLKMHKTVSETMAGALFNAGVKVLTYVPGSGVNEVFIDCNRFSKIANPISFHEEVAYTIAHGAALVGTRSAALMKSHGFIKAENSVTDSLYCGTTAGFVTVIFSDSSGSQSDSILDIEAFVRGIGIPYQKADRADIYSQIIHLFEQSEKRSLPHALIMESHDVAQSIVSQDWFTPTMNRREYRRDIIQHVLCPFFVDYQHEVLQHKLKNQVWQSIPRPVIPRLPEALPEKWKPAAAAYADIFSVLRSIRGSLVTGDTGVSSLFACEPYNCVDIATYMGGSIPLAVGAYLGGHREAWALTGDFSFIAAGHLGLLEAWQRQIPLKVLIFYNGKAETTGDQPIPARALETVLSGYQQYLHIIKNPQDRDELKSVLNQANQSAEMSIVIADYRNKTVRV